MNFNKIGVWLDCVIEAVLKNQCETGMVRGKKRLLLLSRYVNGGVFYAAVVLYIDPAHKQLLLPSSLARSGIQQQQTCYFISTGSIVYEGLRELLATGINAGQTDQESLPWSMLPRSH